VWRKYIQAATVEDVLQVLGDPRERARVVAGATDLILEIERGIRKDVDTLVDITRIAGLDQIGLEDAPPHQAAPSQQTAPSAGGRMIHLGPLVTHNQCVASKLIREYAFPLAQAAWEVGSPQIRNRGTVAGNLITASPANDTITPLMALGARVTLQSRRGQRIVPLAEFYTGVRRTVLQPDEFLTDIAFPALLANQQGTFIKYALRRAQAISLVNIAMILTRSGDQIESAVITLGAVAPTIIHAAEAEAYLKGRTLNEAAINTAADLAVGAARPISDIRGSAGYRRAMVRVITRRGLSALLQRSERQAFPDDPVLLWGEIGAGPRVGSGPNGKIALDSLLTHGTGAPIVTTINGQQRRFETEYATVKSLLRLLREEAGLVGTKEGCAEGECGACTVFLDGLAVMSCMVPAPRAHGAQITTIEGLVQNGILHPVQQAFINHGAVQCGYCSPGFLMSAAKLLEEKPSPSREQINQALTGNLCRCTGYYKIIEAVEAASGG
jgi:xanthine dehydrogenase iron-sulfur cluster and FAD-binding subunit A